jgi:hypothetical protein
VRRVDEGARLVVPVTDRGDAIGLLELALPRFPSVREVADMGSAAHALAYVLVAARRYTDVFEWGMRSTPFSLAAEIQRRLLPAAYTCEAGQFTLAGWLEPAASVGGDTFDYNLDRDFLQVSITDAVGHQVTAALLATLLVGGLRNGRRKGLDLGEQASYASDCLTENAAPGQFVTGQLLRLDLHSGTAVVVNAGHTLPLHLRGGVVEEIELGVDAPLGVLPGKTFDVQFFHSSPATGSSSSPTACRSAPRHRSTWPRRWLTPRTCTRGKSFTPWVPRCCTRPVGISATTRRWSASTGMAGRPAAGTPSGVPTPTVPRPAPDPRLRTCRGLTGFSTACRRGRAADVACDRRLARGTSRRRSLRGRDAAGCRRERKV